MLMFSFDFEILLFVVGGMVMCPNLLCTSIILCVQLFPHNDILLATYRIACIPHITYCVVHLTCYMEFIVYV